MNNYNPDSNSDMNNIYNMPIGSKFYLKNNDIICILIGYNADKSQVMYIKQTDKTIFENMKFENTVNIRLIKTDAIPDSIADSIIYQPNINCLKI